MSSITYTKGLRTPNSELNAIGFTQFEMFLTEYSVTHRNGVIDTIKQLIAKEDFAKKHKSAWNTHLQKTYRINKRHAGGIIADAIGQYKSAVECRKNHITQLKGKVKSVEKWLKAKRKQLKDGAKFYRRKDWQHHKSGLKLPLSCNLKSHRTNWQQLRFAIHHKARKLAHLQRQVAALGDAPIHVSVPKQQVFIVGSKDEPCGNRNVQWNRDTGVLKFRVPYFLEAKYGKFIETQQGDYKRRIDRMPVDGAKTWHFYYKAGKWNAAVQFTPTKVDRISKHSSEGALGIDLNPGAIGWALTDRDGNLATSGQIPLQMNLPSGQQQAQIVDACLQLIALATTFQVPIVIEKLDFAKKKSQLKEKGRKYARMLSGWAYSSFKDLLGRLCANRGIYLMEVNPAYSSVIGMVKYARMYGLGSDCAAALVIARRAMRLSERLPSSITARMGTEPRRHVWSQWNKLNKMIKSSGIRRHSYYSIANSGSLVKR